MIIVHYEVYVQESRGWMLHARFPRLERDEAIREAKELEATLRIRVKVVRETYNTDDNSFDEAEVYLSGMVRKQAPAKAGTASAGGATRRTGKPTAAKSGARGASRLPPPQFAPRRRPESTGSATGVLWRLLLICLVGLGVALGAVRVTPEIVIFLFDYGFRMSPESYGHLLFAVFVGVFLMVSVPLAFRFLPQSAEITIRKPAFTWSRKQAIDAELKRSLNTLVVKAAAQGRHEEEEPPPPEDLLPEIRPDDVEETLPEIRPDEDEETLPDIRPGEDEKPFTAETAAGRDVDGLSVVSMRFLGGAINAVKSVSPTLDKFSKFALNLYMAGAVEGLAESKRLDEAAQRRLLRSALETLGTSGDIAARFHDKISDYMVEPRYMQIIQTGRNAMDAWMAGEEAVAHGPLAAALKDFNKPAGDKKQSIMTVMFTDMVGSTDLTQARGDVAAQDVVRRHNAIVRTALAQFLGKEVKHTGDGIMASFNSAANAVEATVVIQRQVAITNKKNPELGLHLRIGLNAGEPIQEEDDLFGTTVQLAARVCAATDTDEILCTQVVRDLSFGKTVAFRPAGDHALKGFKEKLPLFEVVWRE